MLKPVVVCRLKPHDDLFESNILNGDLLLNHIGSVL
jgi:hypothetical protein